MPCKAATGFPQCDLNICSNDRLRGKGGITCSLVNKSLVWFDGRIGYALHSIDFFYCSPFPGGFTYFQSCSSGQTDCNASLSSPLISSGAKWKCFEFWYYTAYPGQLKVLLVPNETTSHTLKTYNYNSYGWRLERVPLSANFNYQVNIIEKSLSCLLLQSCLFVFSATIEEYRRVESPSQEGCTK